MADEDPPEITRRNYLQAGAVSLAMVSSAAPGDIQTDSGGSSSGEGVQDAAHLFGPASARPAPDSAFFDDKTSYRYIYENYSGHRSFITDSTDEWTPLNEIQRETITEEDDLPAPTNGTHTLKDSYVYVFNGSVTATKPIELGTATALIGRHASVDGFIYTGGGTAIQGTDAGFFARDMYFHAPGGTMFDLTADQTTEMLVESCSVSDAAGIGNIASLGTITGYRVPTFKSSNFEDFDGGLTFDGTPDKIFISGTPMRSVTASNVTLLTFASSLNVDIIDMVDNYVKDVQSDTEVIRVEAGATINDVFQYRGTTHDASVTVSNILTGQAGQGKVGYRIANAYPLRDSSVVGELSLDSPTTTTISSQNTYTQIDGATSLGNESVRVSQPSAGTLKYDGKKNTNVHVTASCTVEAPSNETFAVAIAKNGTVEPTSEAQGEGAGVAPAFVAPSGIEKLTTGDTISLFVKNLDSDSNITVDLYNLNLSGL